MTLQVASFRPEISDQRELRNALGKFATGVAVITTRTLAGRIDGLTVNSFSSVSLDPPLILWSLQRTARSFESFSNSDCFAVNILSADQHLLCRHFAGQSSNKFAGIDYELGQNGCPVFSSNLATFECVGESTVDGGDHVIVIGRVALASYRDGSPLIFSAGVFGTHQPIRDSA